MKRAFRFLLILLFCAALAGAWGGWQLNAWSREPYRGFAGDEQFVDIPAGSGPQAIGRMLVNAGVVHDAGRGASPSRGLCRHAAEGGGIPLLGGGDALTRSSRGWSAATSTCG